MDKQRLDKALTRLGQLLRERRVAGEIAVFGGAAIVLGFDFLDEQVLPEKTAEIRSIARQINAPHIP